MLRRERLDIATPPLMILAVLFNIIITEGTVLFKKIGTEIFIEHCKFLVITIDKTVFFLLK